MNNNFSSISLTNEIFLLGTKEIELVYAPLDSKVFRVSKEGSSAIKSYYLENSKNEIVQNFLKENGIGIKTDNLVSTELDAYNPTELTLSLTSGCNLRCVYCYAHAGENPNTMTYEIAKTAVDTVVKNLIKEKRTLLKVIYHGGGESLVVFPLLKKITELIVKKWTKDVSFFLVTNGTLINEEMTKWFKKYEFRISISMDGPEDIQNKLRPSVNGSSSYEKCIEGMEFLLKENVKFSVRATITKDSVNRIKNMLDIVKRFGVSLKVEPVTPTGRGEYSVEELSAEEFISAYKEAKNYSKQLGLILKSSYDHDMSPKKNYCGGDGRMFCVLPDGYISSCSRVTRTNDLLAKDFLVGKIEGNKLCFYEERISKLQKLSTESFEDCQNCFAKWYCAGGCHNTRLSNSMLMPRNHCFITKSFLWQKIQSQVISLEERRNNESN